MIYVLGSGGGSSAGLNFKVVGGTSAPSNPATNTIWVNTSTAITSWVFHATQPSAAEGKLWIQIGASSPVTFNAVKENRVTVYPMSAKQYVNGAWVDKVAKIYQYDAWADLVKPPFYIFKAGEGALVEFKQYAAAGMSISIKQAYIEIKATGEAQIAMIVTTNAVDLTGYSKLYMRAKCTYAHTSTATGHPPKFGIFSYAPTGYSAIQGSKCPDIAYASVADEDAEKTYSVPIPSDVTQAWVAMGGGMSIQIYDIWVE